MTASKYFQGKQICTMSEFDQCEKKWYILYLSNKKTVHRSMLISQQYRTLLNWIIQGRLFEAERKL